jgi:hypothetical protein
VRRARAGLIDVDDELFAELSAQDFVGRRADGVGDLRRQPAKAGIRFRRRLFHQDGGDDEVGGCAQAADREVVDRALGLDPIVRVGGNRKLAERIALNPKSHTGRLRYEKDGQHHDGRTQNSQNTQRNKPLRVQRFLR